MIDNATVASTPGMLISPLHLGSAERDFTQLGVDQSEFLAVEVQLPQQRRRSGLLIGRQQLLGKPGPALDAEQVSGRAPLDQVAVQDRLHLVFQPGASNATSSSRPNPAANSRTAAGVVANRPA
jgi:hypothetical protein